MKKTNYYYLISGLLAVFFSITHEYNGQQTFIPQLFTKQLDSSTIITFKYIWHIITAENLIFGIAFIAMAFYKKVENTRFIAWLICTILVVRLLVIVSTTLTMACSSLNGLMIDSIAIAIYTALIILGSKKGRQPNN